MWKQTIVLWINLGYLLISKLILTISECDMNWCWQCKWSMGILFLFKTLALIFACSFYPWCLHMIGKSQISLLFARTGWESFQWNLCMHIWKIRKTSWQWFATYSGTIVGKFIGFLPRAVWSNKACIILILYTRSFFFVLLMVMQTLVLYLSCTNSLLPLSLHK